MRLGRGAYSSQIATLKKAPATMSPTHKSKFCIRTLSILVLCYSEENGGTIDKTILAQAKIPNLLAQCYIHGISKKQPTF